MLAHITAQVVQPTGRLHDKIVIVGTIIHGNAAYIDLLIYGYMNADKTQLVLEMYLSPRKLYDAEELAGAYPLLFSITLPFPDLR